MSKRKPGKSTPNKEQPQAQAPEQEESKVEDIKAEGEQPIPPESTPEQEVEPLEAQEGKPKEEGSATLADVIQELNLVKAILLDHSNQIANLKEGQTRKRKAIPNGKVQILDKKTGEIHSSKNSTYQTLLKSGELKELVDQGLFGADPAKNTFGWYALVRAWPERFEEVKAEAATG